jgi:deoxyribonuclease IV
MTIIGADWESVKTEISIPTKPDSFQPYPKGRRCCIMTWTASAEGVLPIVRIGFHLPISKGFNVLYREAVRLQCEVVQIFVKNPRSWVAKTWTDKDREAFRQFDNLPVVAHLSYLPNIARADEESRNLAALVHEAGLCSDLGIDRMIVHCGSRDNTRKGIMAAAGCIEKVLEGSGITLLLENSAGQGNGIGSTVNELIDIWVAVGEKERLGFCLDSAHLFQAGYDVRDKDIWISIFDQIENQCATNAIKLFHLNDSKTSLGGGVDRHWHIGQGAIGLDCFQFLMNDKRLAHLEGVMETPKMGNMDEENMKTMRSLLSSLVSSPPS